MLTLHDAIVSVLKSSGTPLSTKKLAEEINSQRLYVRKDKKAIKSEQISARVRKYPSLSIRNTDGTIALKGQEKEKIFLPDRVKQESGALKDAGNIALCPNCGRSVIIPDDLLHEKYILHPYCGSRFRNPLLNDNNSDTTKTPVSGSLRTGGGGSMRMKIKVFVVLLALTWFLFGPRDCERGEVVSNSAWDASVWQVKRYLKKEYLLDPDSYEGIEWSAVNKKANGGYYVRHKYRAKNSFGGYVIENQVFHLNAEGEVIGVDDYDIYEGLNNK